MRGVAFHEALAVAIHQIAAFAAHAFGDQAAHARNAGGMKLPELHVLQRQSGAQYHAKPVAGIDHGVAAVPEHPPCPAGGEQRGARLDQHGFAGFDVHGGDAEAIAFGIAHQIERKIFVEELRAMLDVLLVQRMQHGVAGAVGGSAGAGGLFAAEILRLPAERALIDLAVVQARKRQAHVFEFVHRAGRFAAHELDRVLVAQPVATLDRVVHVPFPAVVVDIGERGGNAALRRYGMRTRGKYFRYHRDRVVRARQLQRRAQAGAAAADNHCVKLAFRH